MWRNPDFLRAVAAKVTSLTGDSVLLTALAWVALRDTGSVPFLALLTTVTLGVGTLLGPVGGVYLDGPHRRRVMILADLLRTLCLLAFLAVLLWRPTFTWPGALITVALIAAGSAFFSSASVLPNLVPPDELGAATAVMNTMQNWAKIAGPPLGGLLVAGAGLKGVVVFDLLTFLVSAACLLAIRRPFVVGARQQRFGAAFGEGLAFLRGHGPLQTYLVVVSLINAAITLFTLSVPVVVLRVLHGDALLSGAVQGAYQAGMIGAGTAMGIRGARLRLREDSLHIGLGLGLMGAAALVFAWPGVTWLAVLGAGLFGAALMLTSALADARIYRAVPSELLGRGLALVGSVSGVLRPVAVNVGGLLVQTLGVLAPVGLCALLLGGVAAYVVKTRTLDLQDPAAPSGSERARVE